MATSQTINAADSAALAADAETSEKASSVIITLLPIMAVVFVAFMVIGLAMPVLPLHVHDRLGLSTFVVGLVAGSQFTAALISRFWAGKFADARGGKLAVITGLLVATVAGGLYVVSLRFVQVPSASVAILLLGRGILGAAESIIITGALGWGLALGGPQNAGKVIAWVGTAVFAAFAVGAPTGTTLYATHGFRAIALVTVFAPMASLLLVLQVRGVPPTSHTSPGAVKVAKAVWVPGLGLALSSAGFGAITTFAALLFTRSGWSPLWLAFTALSVAFILGRLFLGHLPDKIGGAKVALASVLVEAVGLAVIWLAPTALIAVSGVVLTGLGYALVYPALGLEAIRRAPPESRALVMGAFSAFLDLALGLGSPALGWVAGRFGLRAVFLVSAIAVFSASAVAMKLLRPRVPIAS
jgi:MFS family permease